LYAAISNLSEFEIFEPDDKNTILCILLKGSSCSNYLSGYDESIQEETFAITLDAFILNATTWALVK
jgi:DNA phosphorothioation-dependent restriction protein DptH